MTAKKIDRLSAELVEAARLLNKHEVLSAHDLDRVKALSSPPPSFTSERMAKIRIYKAKMSQSVFAGFLNVTTSTVQKWESPASGKHPGGAAAKLLQIIDKKGVEVLVV